MVSDELGSSFRLERYYFQSLANTSGCSALFRAVGLTSEEKRKCFASVNRRKTYSRWVATQSESILGEHLVPSGVKITPAQFGRREYYRVHARTFQFSAGVHTSYPRPPTRNITNTNLFLASLLFCVRCTLHGRDILLCGALTHDAGHDFFVLLAGLPLFTVPSLALPCPAIS